MRIIALYQENEFPKPRHSLFPAQWMSQLHPRTKTLSQYEIARKLKQLFDNLRDEIMVRGYWKTKYKLHICSGDLTQKEFKLQLVGMPVSGNTPTKVDKY